jgi:hypothetical protein
MVFIGSDDDNVYALNATTGALVWKYKTGGMVDPSSPAVSSGVVYVGSEDDNVYAFGVHDVAVTSVNALDIPSDSSGIPKTVIARGYNLTVNVTASDPGSWTETFNVTVYANTTYVTSQNVTLPSGASITLALTWNTTGFAYGNYTLSAYAWPVPGETNTANNNFTDGWVVVTFPGDILGTGNVSLADLVALARAYGSTPGSSNWNPNADITGSGSVGLQDLVILAQNYEKSVSP